MKQEETDSRRTYLQHPFFSSPLTICAHRGDSVEYPENTLPAFRSAVEMGVDCLETDIHLSRDGHCIVSHDPRVDRTTDGSGALREMDLEELQKLDAGYRFSMDGGKTFPHRGKGITIPTLRELLSEIPEMRFNIDLKDPSGAMVDEFVRVIDQTNSVHRVLGASFYQKPLKLLRRMLPAMATSFAKPEAVTLLLRHGLNVLSLPPRPPGLTFQVPEHYGRLRIVSPRLIKDLHRRGIRIQVWTINDEPDMRRLLDMGVDGIMTDDPARLIKVTGSSHPDRAGGGLTPAGKNQPRKKRKSR